MTLTAPERTTDTEPDGTADRPWRARLAVLGVAAVVCSPVVVAALALAGEPWYPVGDFAHMVFRTSQVGTADTPLVGAYAVKGWAHPGPLLFWMAAPLYRLTGEDPRAVEWTTALVNVVCIVALARVAWRRAGWPLLVTLGTFVGLLLYALTPSVTVSVWNPFVPLLPFLLTVVLVWDAALGRRRSLVLAAIPASIAMQGHLAFVALVAVLVVWLFAWSRWWPRLLPGDGTGADGTGDGPDELPRPPWSPWFGAVRRGLLVGVVLWVGPLLDAVFDLHNPLTVAKGMVTPPATVGPVNAVGLVGRYVRPDGPWLGGAEPQTLDLSVQGSGPLPFLLALAVLAGCVHVARRRRLVDVLALATLTLVLLLASIVATGQIVLPAFHYLTQWLKVVGCLVWLTVAWTLWRAVLEPRVAAVSDAGRRAVATVAGAAVVGAAAVGWGDAAAMEQPQQRDSVAVQSLRHQLADVLPRDQRIRVEMRGDYAAIANPGLFYWLIEDGFDVTTADGHRGLKWGHDHRYDRGEDYDLLITIARNQTATECAADPDATELAFYDGMSATERDWWNEYQFRQLAGGDDITPADTRRARELASGNLRIGVYEGPRACADNPDWEVRQTRDDSVVPILAAAGAATGLVAGGAVLVLRRRRAGADA